MLELIQVTAQYSNAVLVAILPQISDFATRLELPVPLPITQSQVAEFRCRPFKGDIGGYVIFTNHLEVWYQFGHVNGFRTPRSYFNLQDPRDIPRFYGPLKLSKDEALQLARTNILKLGYSLKETFTDQEPEVEMPARIGTNIVPHYQFRWKDPVFGRTVVKIEVDGGRRLIHEMRLLSLYFRRDPPNIAVEPIPLNPRPPITTGTSNDFLAVALPKISEFAKKLELPLKLPVTQAQVDKIEFVDPRSDVRVRLSSGHWFVWARGVIVEFCAPDTVYGRQPPTIDPVLRPLEEYLGKWRLSEGDAIELARRSIRNLGYADEEFPTRQKPVVTKPEQVGDYIVPRYSLRWLTNDVNTGGTVALVRTEVDADRGQLKWLQLVKNSSPAEKQPTPQMSTSQTNRPPTLPMIHDTNVVPYTVDELLGALTNPARQPRHNGTQSPTNGSGNRPLPEPRPNPFE